MSFPVSDINNCISNMIHQQALSDNLESLHLSTKKPLANFEIIFILDMYEHVIEFIYDDILTSLNSCFDV